MKSVFFLLTLLLLSQAALPHPSYGIVSAPNGDIYFVDVLHNDGTLWRLSPNGELEKILTRFHAHNLVIDQRGNLWAAAAIWRQGEIEGEGLNILVKVSPDHQVDTLIYSFDYDIFYGGNFAIGPKEEIYYELHATVFQYFPEGKTRTLIDHKFGRVNSIQCDRQGNLWISDKRHKGGTLYRWNPQDGLQEIATNLLPEKPQKPTFRDGRLQIFYAIDQAEDSDCLYLSDNVGRAIQQITPEGEVSTFYPSQAPWHPVGICFSQGQAIVMEAGFRLGNLGPRLVWLDEGGRVLKIRDID
jgi:hypothetical protein